MTNTTAPNNIVFDPGVISFGGAIVGTPETRTILVTNGTESALTLTVLPPYSLSPSTVPAHAQDFTATITYTPTSAGIHSGTIAVGGRPDVVVQLSGKAVDPISEDMLVGEDNFLIEVPDHGSDVFYRGEKTLERTAQMATYLRLGSKPNIAEPGDTLANIVTDFVDDTRVRREDDETALAQTVPSNFSDADATKYSHKALRELESSKIHTRGGWRDHTDGNRVSTTGGDKVEVIRGNYKMVVMGRQPAPEPLSDADTFEGSVTTWDASGGHIADWRATPGAFTEIGWHKTADTDDDAGTWKVWEVTEKGDYDITYHGTVTERFYGTKHHTIIGSPDDEQDDESVDGWRHYTLEGGTGPTDNRARGGRSEYFRGQIEEVRDEVYAKSVHDIDGSTERPLTLFEDKTFADTISVNEGSRHHRVETHKTEVWADSIEDIVNVSDKLYSQVDGDVHSKVTGDVIEEWYEHHFELFLGAAESLKVGNFLDMRFGATLVELNVAGLAYTTLAMSPTALFDLQAAGAIINVAVSPYRADFVLSDLSTDVNTGTEISVGKLFVQKTLGMFLN